MDENDNNPVFGSTGFEYRVPEDVEPGVMIARITANDADSGDYGKITYLLDRMSTQVTFLSIIMTRYTFFPHKITLQIISHEIIIQIRKKY